jgi:hypothetical protein
VDECLRALHLLARESRQCEAWHAALLEYLQDVGRGSCNAGSDTGSGDNSSGGSGIASSGSGDASPASAEPGSTRELLACRLRSLGALPLTALVPLHSLCCWLVGHTFTDIADLGRETQVEADSLSAAVHLLRFQLQLPMHAPRAQELSGCSGVCSPPALLCSPF